MASSNVPKFGNWEAEENVPYTAYFEKARKVHAPGSKITNPNDPEYNNTDPQSQPPSRTKPEQADPVRRSSEQVRNISYEKSPLHKNSYDGTGRSKPQPNLRAADESVRFELFIPEECARIKCQI